jgi:hypothetical protein
MKAQKEDDSTIVENKLTTNEIGNISLDQSE